VAATAGSLPGGLVRLRQLLRRGLEETATLWPAVRESYKWVKRAARILKNEEGSPVKLVRRRLVQLLVRMRKAAATTGEPSLRAGLKQFLKVTRSYWPGLFGCYDSADLPRTNDDLEHTFGSHRYHERRSSGRRRASPGLVVMGSARLISGLATRLRPGEGLVLRPGYVNGWQELREELERRREARRKQRRFRHDPAAYLTELEQRCLQLSTTPQRKGSELTGNGDSPDYWVIGDLCSVPHPETLGVTMRGRKSALLIVLTPSDRAEIERWQRSTTGPAGLARRGRILLLLDQGKTLKETAELCGLSVRHVRKWAQRFRDDGLAGLHDKPRPGRKPVFSPRGGDPSRQDGLRATRRTRPIVELLGLPGTG
jgi:hypothetical protein